MSHFLSLDFGASTIDIVRLYQSGRYTFRSYEAEKQAVASLRDFFDSNSINVKKIERIFVTGGKSKFFTDSVHGIPVERIDEIIAIGRGGFRLMTWGLECETRASSKKRRRFKSSSRYFSFSKRKIPRSILVVSMGTGTCMVYVQGSCVQKIVKIEHIGGIGVGGGTFLGLSRQLLGETNVERLIQMFCRGDVRKVDLSVFDIVGSSIGCVPQDATASNLGRLAREIEFSPDDLAAGIVNLIGQTIATSAVFAAQSRRVDCLVLTGKLTRVHQICDIIFKTAQLYDVPVMLPRYAGYVSAIGAFEEQRNN